MKLTVRHTTWSNFFRFMRWSKVVAKCAAIGTTITGLVAAFSGSATTGGVISAAGVTTYVATSGMQTRGCEKTRHIPPGCVNKAANMLRQQREIIKGVKSPKGAGLSMNQSSDRAAPGLSGSHFPRRK